MSSTRDDASCRVLLVDTNSDLRNRLDFLLGPHGLSVEMMSSCEEADGFLRANPVSVLLLSSTLPDRSGLQYLKLLRSDPATRSVPLIMLGMRATDIDVALTLDAGADDFVHKPVSPKELERRILALLRRCEAPTAVQPERSARRVGSLEYDEQTHRISYHGTPLALRRTEAGLLACLMAAPGRVFTRSQLVRRVCDSETVHERVIDVHIRRLRALLQPVGADSMIDTVRGVGYRLLDAPQPQPADRSDAPDAERVSRPAVRDGDLGQTGILMRPDGPELQGSP